MAYSVINKPSDYFNTKLYTGNGSTQSITGVGFQPDLVWIKQRNGTGYHNTYDAVRGSTERLQPNVTDAEVTVATSLTSFDSDGFSLGSNGDTNGSSNTTVAWNWLGANGTASNTDGSITSTVSANTTSGFSIVSYTGNGTAGATIGHGLGAVPKMFITKRLDAVSEWRVYNEATGANYLLQLNLTSAAIDNATWNDTAPTSSVFSVSSTGDVNASGGTYIAYCFADVQGFSKFGSYTGNGNSDGTFVYTGFKPAWVMTKRTDSTGNWLMYDNKRIGYNPSNYFLYPNLSNVEDTANSEWLDLYSNGFKIRATSATVNGSGNSYIYMAFAEQPLVGDNPATAR
jgi:hypothetical protein